jgi:peptide/nickel transport system ATP-binding protein
MSRPPRRAIETRVLEVLKKAQRRPAPQDHDHPRPGGGGRDRRSSDRDVRGQPVERSVDDIFYRPRMPYTIRLLGAGRGWTRPERHSRRSKETRRRWSTCRRAALRPRCPMATDACTMGSRSPRPIIRTTTRRALSDKIAAENLTYARHLPGAGQLPAERIPREQRPYSSWRMKRHYPR